MTESGDTSTDGQVMISRLSVVCRATSKPRIELSIRVRETADYLVAKPVAEGLPTHSALRVAIRATNEEVSFRIRHRSLSAKNT